MLYICLLPTLPLILQLRTGRPFLSNDPTDAELERAHAYHAAARKRAQVRTSAHPEA